MFLEGMRKPHTELLWVWNESNTEEIETFLREESAEYISFDFTDNGDGTALLTTEVDYWGVWTVTIEQGQWYIHNKAFSGVSPLPISEEAMAETFTPVPDYPPLTPTR